MYVLFAQKKCFSTLRKNFRFLGVFQVWEVVLSAFFIDWHEKVLYKEEICHFLQIQKKVWYTLVL